MRIKTNLFGRLSVDRRPNKRAEAEQKQCKNGNILKSLAVVFKKMNAMRRQSGEVVRPWPKHLGGFPPNVVHPLDVFSRLVFHLTLLRFPFALQVGCVHVQDSWPLWRWKPRFVCRVQYVLWRNQVLKLLHAVVLAFLALVFCLWCCEVSKWHGWLGPNVHAADQRTTWHWNMIFNVVIRCNPTPLN